MAFPKRIDRNQNEIVTYLRSKGFSVAITSMIGRGFPDLVIGLYRENMEPYTALIEIKDGNKPPSARKLTEDEQKFKDNWQGNYEIISSVEEVNKLMDLILNKD